MASIHHRDGATGASISASAYLTPNGEVVPVLGTVEANFRDTFSGSAIDTTKWSAAAIAGVGIVPTVTSGTLAINLGTTALDEWTLTSRQAFTVPFRLMVGVQMSQRIANNQVTVEVVSVDPNTLLADETNAAAWRIDGTSATTGIYEVQEDGLARLASSASTITTTASASILEIEVGLDAVQFSSRPIDSTNPRNASYVRHVQVPASDRLYAIRIRAKNTGTPATATTATISVVHLLDHQEVNVEVIGGRGSVTPGEGIPAYLVGGLGGSAATPVQGILTNSAGANAVNTLMALSSTTVYTTGRPVAQAGTLNGAAVIMPYSIPENSWQATTSTTPITTTTNFVLKAAGATSMRNYCVSAQMINTSATASDLVILDGSTVLFRTVLPASMTAPQIFTFSPALRGTATTGMNAAAITAGASITANFQGYQAP